MGKKHATAPTVPAKPPSGTDIRASMPSSMSTKAPSDAWVDMLAQQTLLTLWSGAGGSEDRVRQLDAILDALENIAPRDELEGMMASQMIAAHNAVMESFRRAMLPNQSMLGRDENLDHANKLLRSFSSLVETFNKYRGKNQQKVVVKHVHVHEGAQAIVGMVTPQGGGAAER
jgi:hypothetical protein